MKRILYLLASAAAIMVLNANIIMAESSGNSFTRGFERHLQGDLQSAVIWYSKAIDENSEHAMAYQMRGIAQQQLKKYPDAINDYTLVITTGDPSFKVVGYYNRGVVKNMTGDFAGAIYDFSQTINLDKKMAAAFFHRGISKSKIGDLAGRFEDFRQAAHLGEYNAEKWLNTYYPEWKLPRPVPSNPLPPTVAPVSAAPTASPS